MYITALIRKWCEEVARTQPGTVGEQVAFDYLCTAMNIQVAVDAARDSTAMEKK